MPMLFLWMPMILLGGALMVARKDDAAPKR